MCQLATQARPECQTYLEQVFTPDRVWGLVVPFCATLFGAFTTFAVQTALKRREERQRLRERLIGFIMTTSRIVADMQNVQGLLNYYRETNNPGFELWQAAHTLQFTPGFRPDISGLDCLTRLRSAQLVDEAMHLYSEYAAIIDVIAAYNELRLKFTAAHRDSTVGDQETAIIWANMVRHLEFIETTAALIIEEAGSVQQLVFKKSKAALGSAAFLELADS